jgi:hypothetical protein
MERRNTALERQKFSPGLECASAVRQRDAAQLFSSENLLINAQNISRSKEVIHFYDFLETNARTFLMTAKIKKCLKTRGNASDWRKRFDCDRLVYWMEAKWRCMAAGSVFPTAWPGCLTGFPVFTGTIPSCIGKTFRFSGSRAG